MPALVVLYRFFEYSLHDRGLDELIVHHNLDKVENRSWEHASILNACEIDLPPCVLALTELPVDQITPGTFILFQADSRAHRR